MIKRREAKKWRIISFLIIFILVSISSESAISISTSNHIKQIANPEKISLNEKQICGYPNFPRDKIVMIGKYQTLEVQGIHGFSRKLKIICEEGDILIFGGQWQKSGYSSWYYVLLHSKEYIYFLLPSFVGICRDGKIYGMASGDFYISRSLPN